MPRKVDIRLGQFLIQRQWCTLRQVNEALSIQRVQKRNEASKPLGRVLVEKGYLEEDRLTAALFDLGMLVLACPACEQQYSVSEYDAGADYECPACGRRLDVGESSRSDRAVIPYASAGAMQQAACRAPTSGVPPASAGEPAPADSPVSPSRSKRPPTAGARSDLPSRAARANEQDEYIGKVFGGCRLIEKIAAGGMGVVYRALQLNLSRMVAVKVLSKELSNDESFVRRFIEEARSAAQLNHGNIVHINDVGDYHGVFYFTMEYVDGVTLKDELQEHERLPVRRAVDIVLQVCGALQHAHSRGIIHRDIKPENIMITRDGLVKLADLGLAKKLTPSGAENLTHAGSILGTPFYMAPEQAKDFSQVDERSDIYSLGVTFFKMLSGSVPFSGRTPIEVMLKVVEGQRPALHDLCPDIPEAVEATLDRMMDRIPERRYQTVSELVQDLERLRDALPAAKERDESVPSLS
ncbi:MAG: protein kinase [Planctomycetes bacterium]|nr:protein kinase [Planctomycetota bacterium]